MPGEVVSFHYPTCIFFALQQKLVQAELRLDLDVVVFCIHRDLISLNYTHTDSGCVLL